jgi:hypothetical protein
MNHIITRPALSEADSVAELQRAVEFIATNNLAGRVISICPGVWRWKTMIQLTDLADLERVAGTRLPGARHGNTLQYNATVSGFELGCCVRIEPMLDMGCDEMLSEKDEAQSCPTTN